MTKIGILDQKAVEVEKTNQAWHDAIKKLSDPYVDLANRRAEKEAAKHRKVKLGLFSSLFAPSEDLSAQKNNKPEVDLDGPTIDDTPLQTVPKVKGLYLYGSPGCGKTFLMDMFFKQVNIHGKKRVAFESFNLYLNHLSNEHHKKKLEDPMFKGCMEVGMHNRLFCFDEMQVKHAIEAVTMRKFFDVLWSLRVVVVVTYG